MRRIWVVPDHIIVLLVFHGQVEVPSFLSSVRYSQGSAVPTIMRGIVEEHRFLQQLTRIPLCMGKQSANRSSR